MTPEERAALVREIRIEMKQYYSNTAGYTHGAPANQTSRQRMERARTRSRFDRVRAGESSDGYVRRTAEGGDESYGRAAARYDLRRPRGAPASETWDDGYTNYDGWAESARRRAATRRGAR